jgi:hypothetical protein
VHTIRLPASANAERRQSGIESKNHSHRSGENGGDFPQDARGRIAIRTAAVRGCASAVAIGPRSEGAIPPLFRREIDNDHAPEGGEAGI